MKQKYTACDQSSCLEIEKERSWRTGSHPFKTRLRKGWKNSGKIPLRHNISSCPWPDVQDVRVSDKIYICCESADSQHEAMQEKCRIENTMLLLNKQHVKVGLQTVQTETVVVFSTMLMLAQPSCYGHRCTHRHSLWIHECLLSVFYIVNLSSNIKAFDVNQYHRPQVRTASNSFSHLILPTCQLHLGIFGRTPHLNNACIVTMLFCN